MSCFPTYFDCGPATPPSCLFNDFVAQSRRLKSVKPIKKPKKSANPCIAYGPRSTNANANAKAKMDGSNHNFNADNSMKQQKECTCCMCPKRDLLSKQNKNKQNYQWQDMKRFSAAKRMEVINEERDECAGRADDMENDSSSDTEKCKNFQNSCADFLSIVHDTVVESVRACIECNLREYFYQNMEKLEALYGQMMRTECLLSKMHLDLVDKINQQGEKNQKHCEIILQLVSKVDAAIDNNCSCESKEKTHCGKCSEGCNCMEKSRLNAMQAELLSALPQLNMLDPTKLLQSLQNGFMCPAMQPANEMNCVGACPMGAGMNAGPNGSPNGNTNGYGNGCGVNGCGRSYGNGYSNGRNGNDSNGNGNGNGNENGNGNGGGSGRGSDYGQDAGPSCKNCNCCFEMQNFLKSQMAKGLIGSNATVEDDVAGLSSGRQSPTPIDNTSQQSTRQGSSSSIKVSGMEDAKNQTQTSGSLLATEPIGPMARPPIPAYKPKPL